MKRRFKPDEPLVFYHIISRCAQQKYWLQTPYFKRRLIQLLIRYSQIFYVQILNLSIMDNHIHITLAVRKDAYNEQDIRRRFELDQSYNVNPRPFHAAMGRAYYRRYTDLSEFVGGLKWRFSLEHNKREETKGTFWDAPFLSFVVEPGAHLLRVLAYVELNAVRARMVQYPDQYAYCTSHEIKQALEKGNLDPTPKVPGLDQFPDGQRGQAYLDLGRYLADMVREEGKVNRSAIPEFLKFWLGAKFFRQTIETLKTKRLTRYGSQIIGSDEFTAHIIGQTSRGANTAAGSMAISKQAPIRRSADKAPT